MIRTPPNHSLYSNPSQLRPASRSLCPGANRPACQISSTPFGSSMRRHFGTVSGSMQIYDLPIQSKRSLPNPIRFVLSHRSPLSRQSVAKKAVPAPIRKKARHSVQLFSSQNKIDSRFEASMQWVNSGCRLRTRWCRRSSE